MAKIGIYLGHGFEGWLPAHIYTRGIGGSELMAWLVARGLSLRGHDVSVFSQLSQFDPGGVKFIDPKTAELCLNAKAGGSVNAVKWFAPPEIRGKQFDLLISSRRAELFDQFSVKTKRAVFWAHDVAYGDALTEKRAKCYENFVCLSDWHCQVFQQAHPYTKGRVILIRNGLDLEEFGGREELKEVPDPVFEDNAREHRMIWASSPDRGLSRLLDIMPTIRQAVPDATLEIYYGFLTLRARAANHQNIALQREIENLIAKIDSIDGVILKGRVGRRELLNAFAGAKLWAYPTNWPETSCLAAMEAQLSRTPVLTYPYAALAETVRPSYFFLGNDFDHERNFALECISVLRGSHFSPAYTDDDLDFFDIEKRLDHWEELIP